MNDWLATASDKETAVIKNGGFKLSSPMEPTFKVNVISPAGALSFILNLSITSVPSSFVPISESKVIVACVLEKFPPVVLHVQPTFKHTKLQSYNFCIDKSSGQELI